MSLRWITGGFEICGVAAAIVLASSPPVFGGPLDFCWHRCPPPYVHCQEGRPKIRIKCACPKPVCDPCNLEHFGYYPTCWHPWSYLPDWSRCPVAPPAMALVPGSPMVPTPEMIGPPSRRPGHTQPGGLLPRPKKIDGKTSPGTLN